MPMPSMAPLRVCYMDLSLSYKVLIIIHDCYWWTSWMPVPSTKYYCYSGKWKCCRYCSHSW